MIEETKQRLGFYRKMQLWPIANELDFENWLDNFQSKEDKEIASQILAALFTYQILLSIKCCRLL